MDFTINEMLEMQRQLQEKYKVQWEPGPVRDHLVEELADVLMYYSDILLCYGITAEELRRAYCAKFQRNLNRW